MYTITIVIVILFLLVVVVQIVCYVASDKIDNALDKTLHWTFYSSLLSAEKFCRAQFCFSSFRFTGICSIPPTLPAKIKKESALKLEINIL